MTGALHKLRAIVAPTAQSEVVAVLMAAPPAGKSGLRLTQPDEGPLHGHVIVFATTVSAAEGALDHIFRGVAVHRTQPQKDVFEPGEITNRDVLRAQVQTAFDRASREDVETLRARAAAMGVAHVFRRRKTLRELVQEAGLRMPLRCPTHEQWRAAAASKGRGEMCEWAIDRWFMGDRAPEAVECEAYALMAAENARRRGLG
jgi:hypothetical protein